MLESVPTYFAWWEFYPQKFYVINKPTVIPGHKFSAEVSYDSSKDTFTAMILDTTSGSSFTTTFQNKHHAQRSSAEWITGGPLSAPLTRFTTTSLNPANSAFYGSDYTSIPSINCASVSGFGITGCGSIGAYNSTHPSTVYLITMVAKSGASRASPSPLSTSGTSFYVTWMSLGP